LLEVKDGRARDRLLRRGGSFAEKRKMRLRELKRFCGTDPPEVKASRVLAENILTRDSTTNTKKGGGKKIERKDKSSMNFVRAP